MERNVEKQRRTHLPTVAWFGFTELPRWPLGTRASLVLCNLTATSEGGLESSCLRKILHKLEYNINLESWYMKKNERQRWRLDSLEKSDMTEQKYWSKSP